MKFSTHLQTAVFDSPLGPITLAASAQGLAGAWFEGDLHRPDTSAWPAAPTHPLLQRAQHQLQAYFAGQATRFDLPLDLQNGTAFQQTVWRALLALPFGTSTSYGALSVQLGKPKAMRAVGAAVGRNPLIIFVPCHRVLGADGALTGFAAGLPRKRALLQLEKIGFRP
ncbi:MAG: cysteine methyltransferase [Curvibacter sp. PD_MW3]|nr:MAG: cysteine methyltransferase [Curvibacter sp. PD_MW3]